MSSIDEDLHDAVRNKDIKTVEQLLLRGANIDAIYYGWTPFQQAVDIGNEDISLFLVDKGCNITYHDMRHISPFEDAIDKSQVKVVECLLNHGVDGNAALSNGEPPILVAVEKECLPLVSVLVSTGNLNLNVTNKLGESPLYVAALEGYHKICQILAAAGADVNFICDDDAKQTPLITATANEHISVVKTLLKYNCDLNLQDGDEWTALWHAYTNCNEELLELLLKAGADKSIPNRDGITILEDAKENEDDDIIEILIKY
ncbi:poly [ADP-ribose] polymerase tankyrase-2-like [Gigantopelta aegis]|uniref:poly [ADP-ribose] polymerase tankyrase-2-like n=1 Tax=Gigantopelta aegis TaxID=1735272 RepID=UPI001B88880E|nr:poly [ADP-ribose] polymerase tankyrase-2-like [Gigantopelta aegis]